MAELIVVDSTDERTHVALAGRLDVRGVQRVQLQFTSHTAARKRSAIVDLSRIEFISSLGIGMIVSVAKALRAHGSSLILLVPAGEVDRVLRLASVHQVIPMAATHEEALALLDGAAG